MRTQTLLSHWNIYKRTLAYGSTLTIVSITRDNAVQLHRDSVWIFLRSPYRRRSAVWITSLHATPSDCREVCDPWSSNDLVHCNPVKYDHCHFGHSEHACEVYVTWCWHLCKWGTSRNYDCRESWKSKRDFTLQAVSFNVAFMDAIRAQSICVLQAVFFYFLFFCFCFLIYSFSK